MQNKIKISSSVFAIAFSLISMSSVWGSEWKCKCFCVNDSGNQTATSNIPADHGSVKTAKDCEEKFKGDKCEGDTDSGHHITGKINSCQDPRWLGTLADIMIE